MEQITPQHVQVFDLFLKELIGRLGRSFAGDLASLFQQLRNPTFGNTQLLGDLKLFSPRSLPLNNQLKLSHALGFATFPYRLELGIHFTHDTFNPL